MIAPASRKIGKYEILRKLGRGGMADVYLAQEASQERPVALKLIEHAPDSDIQDSIEAERRGARLQAHLAAVDPHVAQIFEYGDVDGYFYVAMEYIEGQDLAELLRKGPLAVEFAVDAARAVAQTLQKAHDLQVAIEGKNFHGIVHGDIKPKNIRIDSRGEVRVLDFGIAKALTLSRKLTRNEFGSVPYGSPERLEAGIVNVQSDLWSLGVMLYEMVTGLQPYRADTTERLESVIRSRVPPDPAPDPCPEPLRRILVKAMAPEPELRYQSAQEFDEDLAAFRNGTQPRAVAEDLDATRRTVRPVIDDETRRTGAQPAPALEPEDTRRTGALAAQASEQSETRRAAQIHFGTWPPPKPSRKPLPPRVRKMLTGVGLFFIGFFVWLSISSIVLYGRGKALAREIDSEQLTDPDQIWDRWTQLAKDSDSSWLLAAPRKAIERKFLATADRPIASYRNGEVVKEANWKSARDLLAKDLTLDPQNDIRGRLRLVEGHLERIDGMAHHNATELNDAVAKFNEAQQLMPKSPDPELGLAWIYVYGLKDIDRAYQALQQAEQRGFALGNREKAQLADGYRARADSLFWDSRNVRGMPQEKDEVQRAKDDYGRALQLYQSIAPWGNSRTSITKIESSLDSVNFRLHELADEENAQKSIPEKVKSLIDDVLGRGKNQDKK
jgi:serine/threonine-protein kinase